MLRKLIEYLPVSRGRYKKALEAISQVIDGLVEAESNHCQIEMSIMQQLQKNKMGKSPSAMKEKSNHDPAFV